MTVQWLWLASIVCFEARPNRDSIKGSRMIEKDQRMWLKVKGWQVCDGHHSKSWKGWGLTRPDWKGIKGSQALVRNPKLVAQTEGLKNTLPKTWPDCNWDQRIEAQVDPIGWLLCQNSSIYYLLGRETNATTAKIVFIHLSSLRAKLKMGHLPKLGSYGKNGFLDQKPRFWAQKTYTSLPYLPRHSVSDRR